MAASASEDLNVMLNNRFATYGRKHREISKNILAQLRQEMTTDKRELKEENPESVQHLQDQADKLVQDMKKIEDLERDIRKQAANQNFEACVGLQKQLNNLADVRKLKAIQRRPEPELNEQLMRSCADGRLGQVKNMLQLGADVNFRDEDGVTILMCAAAMGHEDIVKFLLSRDPVPHVFQVDHDGKHVLRRCRRMHESIKNLILDEMSKVNSLVQSGKSGDLDIIRFWLEAKQADVDSQDERGYTALMYAAKYGHKEVVRFLLMREPAADISIKNDAGFGALYYASKGKHSEIMSFIRMRKRVNEYLSDQVDATRKSSLAEIEEQKKLAKRHKLRLMKGKRKPRIKLPNPKLPEDLRKKETKRKNDPVQILPTYAPTFEDTVSSNACPMVVEEVPDVRQFEFLMSEDEEVDIDDFLSGDEGGIKDSITTRRNDETNKPKAEEPTKSSTKDPAPAPEVHVSDIKQKLAEQVNKSDKQTNSTTNGTKPTPAGEPTSKPSEQPEPDPSDESKPKPTQRGRGRPRGRGRVVVRGRGRGRGRRAVSPSRRRAVSPGPSAVRGAKPCTKSPSRRVRSRSPKRRARSKSPPRKARSKSPPRKARSARSHSPKRRSVPFTKKKSKAEISPAMALPPTIVSDDEEDEIPKPEECGQNNTKTQETKNGDQNIEKERPAKSPPDHEENDKPSEESPGGESITPSNSENGTQPPNPSPESPNTSQIPPAASQAQIPQETQPTPTVDPPSDPVVIEQHSEPSSGTPADKSTPTPDANNTQQITPLQHTTIASEEKIQTRLARSKTEVSSKQKESPPPMNRAFTATNLHARKKGRGRGVVVRGRGRGRGVIRGRGRGRGGRRASHNLSQSEKQEIEKLKRENQRLLEMVEKKVDLIGTPPETWSAIVNLVDDAEEESPPLLSEHEAETLVKMIKHKSLELLTVYMAVRALDDTKRLKRFVKNARRMLES